MIHVGISFPTIAMYSQR